MLQSWMSAQTPLANSSTLSKFINPIKNLNAKPSTRPPLAFLHERQTKALSPHNQFIKMDKYIQTQKQDSCEEEGVMKGGSTMASKGEVQARMQHFLSLVAQSKSFQLAHQLYGFRLLVVHPLQSQKQLDCMTFEAFGKTFNELQAASHQYGFNVLKKASKKGSQLKIAFRFKEPVAFGKQEVNIEEDSSSNANQEEQFADDFPKEEEMEKIAKSKDDRAKGFHKPNVVLSKAQSDGLLLGTVTKKKNVDQNSLEVKLYEQDPFSTPLAFSRKNTSNNKRLSEEDHGAAAGVEQAGNYKQSYEKCSRLIDNTMMEILAAHRNKKIADKADDLLNKVVQIYDMLSDNIENVNAVLKDFEGRKVESKDNQLSSPGFKPLNGMNDNLK